MSANITVLQGVDWRKAATSALAGANPAMKAQHRRFIAQAGQRG
jgi:hypothetical protein